MPWGTAGVGLDDIDAKSTPEDSQNWYNEYPTWKTYDINALTQKWVDGTASNNGVLLWATDEDDYTNGDEKWVYSSEYTGDVSKRPKLVVTYTVDPIANYQYDALGRPTTVTYGNGVTETNQYDPDRYWITRRDYKDGSTNVFYFDNTSYDAAGNLLHQNYKHASYALDSMDYNYDNLYQITQFKENGNVIRSYDYDANGNLTSFTGKTLTYGNSNNQLTGDGSRTFSYDTIGQVTQVNTTTISYDFLSNMTGYGTNTYAYDASGQRIRKTESGVSTYYITNGAQVLAEYTSDAGPDAEYIYGREGMLVKFDPVKEMVELIEGIHSGYF